MKRKKINRKDRKYPALDNKTNLKIRAEEIDFPYASELNEKDRMFLNKFAEEYINADFRHEKPLHKSKKQKREIYQRNNKRNNDSYSKAKAMGQVYDVTPVEEAHYDGEEALNDVIDKTRKITILIDGLIETYSLPNEQYVKDKLYELFVRFNFSFLKVNAFLFKHYK